MSDTKLERRVETEKVEEPAKAWRNKWFVTHPVTMACTVCGKLQSWALGMQWEHCSLPSCEIAEEKARNDMAMWRDDERPFLYVGAFPVPA